MYHIHNHRKPAELSSLRCSVTAVPFGLIQYCLERNGFKLATTVCDDIMKKAIDPHTGTAHFYDLLSVNSVFGKIIGHNLSIPRIHAMKKDTEKIREAIIRRYGSGLPATAKIDPLIGGSEEVADVFSISICSVDGQVININPPKDACPMGQLSRLLLHAIASEQYGAEKLRQLVSNRPSARDANTFSVDDKGRPHNPYLTSGALALASLFTEESSDSGTRFEKWTSRISTLSGRKKPNFSQTTFLRLRDEWMIVKALASFLKAKGKVPKKTDPTDVADFYFQTLSVELHLEDLACIAATFANRGVNPLTRERALSEEVVDVTLPRLYAYGMNNFTGTWMFDVGVPAIASGSGHLLLIIPGVMGVAIWSPPLNEQGVSLKGFELAKTYVSHHGFHLHLMKSEEEDDKMAALERRNRRSKKAFELRRPSVAFGSVSAQRKEAEQFPPNIAKSVMQEQALLAKIFVCIREGDVVKMRKLVGKLVNKNTADYDRRTALHVACVVGSVPCVEALLDLGLSPIVEDRWGNTPYDEAKLHHQEDVCSMLEELYDLGDLSLSGNIDALYVHRQGERSNGSSPSSSAEEAKARVDEEGSLRIVANEAAKRLLGMAIGQN
mmetsp:Transcript_20900/g.53964  ORF Transcript_20900/g.53964 Transcript_20900/m.53964 type:complete len:611 (-) Transcript_20900:320-2152(-)